MAANEIPSSNRSLDISGNASNLIGSAIVAGDNNTLSIQVQQASLPQPETVDIQVELRTLQTILASLNDPIASGVAQKLEQEAAKPNPDKTVIATTLETGLTYAKTLSSFAETIDKLRPHVEAAASWLGKHGHKLLPLVGLAL